MDKKKVEFIFLYNFCSKHFSRFDKYVRVRWAKAFVKSPLMLFDFNPN
jgi:hypothetical protein